jgi:phosphopantothenoylcysteine decarboxylase/phosphopantothenate--cysteine ligase
MNVNMWDNPATQANIDLLRARGVKIVDPDSGYLACGMVGAGRLATNDKIIEAVLTALGATPDLAGETVLVTAGGTREPIDPVRYIGNRSSGKMGYALAEAALRRGAKVMLISGPTDLKPPAEAEFISVQTAREMHLAVLNHFERATVVVKAAAVADFTVRNVSEQKIKREGAVTLELEPTPDILAAVAAQKGSRIMVGFAAETQDVLENARKKMLAKGVDAIVVNDVSQPGIGFDSERNRVSIVTSAGVEHVPEMSKWEVAHRVLDTVIQLRAGRTIRT